MVYQEPEQESLDTAARMSRKRSGGLRLPVEMLHVRCFSPEKSARPLRLFAHHAETPKLCPVMSMHVKPPNPKQ